MSKLLALTRFGNYSDDSLYVTYIYCRHKTITSPVHIN